MSAADLGRRLLAEVEESSVSEILATLSATTNTYGHLRITGNDSVDRLIAVHHGSNAARGDYGQGRRQPCIEITSPGTDDGKTQLLYHTIALAILPSSIGGVSLGGQQSAVVLFDCDGTFNVNRLIVVIRRCIADAIARQSAGEDGVAIIAIDKDELATTIEHALQHLHVLSPQTIASLIKTLENLPTYLLDDSRHYSMHRRVHSIMLDSATAFYWADRNDGETQSVATTVKDASNKTKAHADSAYPKLRAALNHLSQHLTCPIIYTASNLFARSGSNQSYSVAPSLPKSWHTFPTARLLIKRDEVRGLPIAISAEEAVREAKDRNEAVAQGLFSVVVNEDRSEDWTSEVRDEMLRTRNSRTVVRITELGVSIAQ